MDFKPDVLKQALLKDLSLIDSKDEVAYFRSQALLASVFKKYAHQGRDALLHTEAISSFMNRNEALSQGFTVPNHRQDLFQAWQFRLHDDFNTGPFQTNVLTLDSCLAYAKAGPGASRGTKHTNFLDKMFNSQMTYTKECLYTHYLGGLSARWYQAESLRDELHSKRLVTGSTLTSVPKDVKKNRCICTEPILNMFYQLGAKHVLNNVLVSRYHLDIRSQEHINKKLALRGSIDGTNATLDLKDASDNIHYALCKALLPHNVFSTLDIIRSPKYTVDNKDINFNMMSSMGNGFTFSLMTLLLTSLLHVFLTTKQSRYIPDRDGIYGDDIILPSCYANEFCDVLSDFGFIVNFDKSFFTGDFRESCGGDFYRGHNVRGIYIKKVTNEPEIYSAFNRLHYWSVMYGIPIPSALLYLKGLVVFRPIPLHEAEYSGFRIPYEQATLRKRDRNGTVIYHGFVPITRGRKVGIFDDNHFGALIANLGGYVVGQRVTIREDKATRYKVKKLRTPYWNRISNDISSSWKFGFSPELTPRDLSVSWDSLLEAA